MLDLKLSDEDAHLEDHFKNPIKNYGNDGKE